MPPDRIFRFVRWHDLDYERLGWMWVRDFGAYHGQFSVLCEWRCNCPCIEPTSTRRSPMSYEIEYWCPKCQRAWDERWGGGGLRGVVIYPQTYPQSPPPPTSSAQYGEVDVLPENLCPPCRLTQTAIHLTKWTSEDIKTARTLWERHEGDNAGGARYDE
jgi:hypothetical protein